jgi:hypothetical protein
MKRDHLDDIPLSFVLWIVFGIGALLVGTAIAMIKIF